MKKKTSVICSSVLAISMFAGIASAHVTVQPKETTQGKYEVFTVRVPSEKENSRKGRCIGNSACHHPDFVEG
ncbi:hypothetical protein [Ammoniphilus sp. 3BR4]|uniref:hypothetical protein n=1 Tax=Ammoniphilus sp. 3BR4 TaxID=3158265 RepID=UPI003466A3BC